MNVEALIPSLWARYPFLEDESLSVRHGGIKEPDVERWAAECGRDRQSVYDGFARHLAIAFHRGELPFAFCDAVLNDLHEVITLADDARPNLFWRVFLAFDEGEYHRSADRSDDPVAEHTVPAIAQIVKSL